MGHTQPSSSPEYRALNVTDIDTASLLQSPSSNKQHSQQPYSTHSDKDPPAGHRGHAISPANTNGSSLQPLNVEEGFKPAWQPYGPWWSPTRSPALKIGLASLAGLMVCAVVIMGIVDATSIRRGSSMSKIEQAVRDSVPAGHDVIVPPTNGKPIQKQNKQPDTDAAPLPVLDPRVNYSSLLKPAYHLVAPYEGWMNDPNGMMQVQPGGPVHVFYQLNPAKPLWGSPWWGHSISWDLAHWMELPPALLPDQWYDKDGVFSGSATVMPDGSPVMLYTGVMNFTEYGFYYQQQAMAVPANLSDPLLVSWTKLSNNPLPGMGIPPGGTHAQFRDPVTAWPVNSNELKGLMTGLQQYSSSSSRLGEPSPAVGNDTGSVLWMTAVGALDDCLGAAALYVSNDSLRTWTYAGSLFSQLSQNYTRYATCLPPEDQRDKPPEGEGDDSGTIPSGSRGFGGHCDQFGHDCRMWECPDFFEIVPGISVFKYSDQERGRFPFARDFYVLGESQYTNWTMALVQDSHDAYSAVMSGEPFAPRVVDYGAVYASKSFATEGGSRRLWLGWVYEESRGCTEVCSDGTPFILDFQQWQGAQTLPREITFDPHTPTLLFNPVPELAKLRDPTPLASTAITLDTASASSGNAAEGLVVEQILAEEEASAGSANVSAPGNDSVNTTAAGWERSHHHSPSGHRQIELRLRFDLQQDSHAGDGSQSGSGSDNSTTQIVILGLRLTTGKGHYTDVLLNGTVAPSGAAPGRRLHAAAAEQWADEPRGSGMQQQLQHASRQLHEAAAETAAAANDADAANGHHTYPVVQHMSVRVDRTNSGGMSQKRAQGGKVHIPADGVSGKDLALTVFVDRSILEVYALGGRAVVTSRIYPTPVGPPPASGSAQQAAGAEDVIGEEQLGAWGLQVFSSWAGGKVQAHVDVYEMGSCWLDPASGAVP